MPEEINRVVADHLSQLLFCPTSQASENLKDEGITTNVFKVGDVMYDSTLFAISRAKRQSDILDELNLTSGDFALATIHRAENTETKADLLKVIDWLKTRAEKMTIVMPLHPRTKSAAEKFGINIDGIKLCSPLSYFDMTQLLVHCTVVYSDSGGVQKEAYFHSKPCVTLRNETEWVETIEKGWNRLWHVGDYAPRVQIDEYGDGNSAHIILMQIENYLDKIQ